MNAIDQEKALSLARAHVGTLQRATEYEDNSVNLDDARVLEESGWPKHNIEAGWLYLQSFLRLRRKQIRTVDLAERAKTVWREVAKSSYAKPCDVLRAETAATAVPLWIRQKSGNNKWTKREKERQVLQFQKLENTSLDAYYSSNQKEEAQVVGAITETICFDLLNRLSLHEGSGVISLPSQSWYDTGMIGEKNFDLWQCDRERLRKVQVKTGSEQREQVAARPYADDIAVVYLQDHCTVHPTELASYLKTAPLEDEGAIAIARSIQTDINNHFDTLSAEAA